MLTHAILRILIAGLTMALITGVMIRPAGAQNATTWTSQESQEGIFVQACDGFDLTTNYSVTRTFQMMKNYADGRTYERSTVTFAGAIGSRDVSLFGLFGSAQAGKSFAYDGHFTRTVDYDEGIDAITDLLLHFEVGTPGMFTVSIPEVGFKLAASPTSVIQTIVPNTLQMDLCGLFGSA
jgi:hypothetical protein